MEMMMDEYHKYLNTETGKIITVSSEDLGIAEDSAEDDDFSEYSDWQRDAIEEAMDVVMSWTSRKYIELPDKYDIHEYNIMEAFCGLISNEKISNELYSAIKGKGAFRRFRDTIDRNGVEDDWYSFRRQVIEANAIKWCNHNNILYES
jgi:hypothetical protein